jgi:hypothetical protein
MSGGRSVASARFQPHKENIMKLTRAIILGLAFLMPAVATTAKAADEKPAAEGAAAPDAPKKGKKGKKGAAKKEKEGAEGAAPAPAPAPADKK